MRIKSLFHRFGYCTGLIFIDKDLFENVGGFVENLSAGEDGTLLRAGKQKGSFGILPAAALGENDWYQRHWEYRCVWLMAHDA